MRKCAQSQGDKGETRCRVCKDHSKHGGKAALGGYG